MKKNTFPILDIYKRKVQLPSGKNVRLSPIEFALYRLFLSHPEGIKTETLSSYYDELSAIYAKHSRYDDKNRQNEIVKSLCNNIREDFYVYISRIKRKFVSSLDYGQARKYIIQRSKSGEYRINCLAFNNSKNIKNQKRENDYTRKKNQRTSVCIS